MEMCSRTCNNGSSTIQALECYTRILFSSRVYLEYHPASIGVTDYILENSSTPMLISNTRVSFIQKCKMDPSQTNVESAYKIDLFTTDQNFSQRRAMEKLLGYGNQCQQSLF